MEDRSSDGWEGCTMQGTAVNASSNAVRKNSLSRQQGVSAEAPSKRPVRDPLPDRAASTSFQLQPSPDLNL